MSQCISSVSDLVKLNEEKAEVNSSFTAIRMTYNVNYDAV